MEQQTTTETTTTESAATPRSSQADEKHAAALSFVDRYCDLLLSKSDEMFRTTFKK